MLQVVSMRLAQHVLKNQDKLIAGITGVTHVEDDVKVTWGASQHGRGCSCWLAAVVDQTHCMPTMLTHQHQGTKVNGCQPVLRAFAGCCRPRM